MKRFLSLAFLLLFSISLDASDRRTSKKDEVEQSAQLCFQLLMPPSKLPFDNMLKDPIDRLRKTRTEAEAHGKAYQAEYEKRRATGEYGADYEKALTDIGNAYLERVRKSALNLRSLLSFLKQKSAELGKITGPKLAALDQFTSLLPQTIGDWRPEAIPVYLRSTPVKIQSQTESLLLDWLSLVNNSIGIAGLVRAIRSISPETLDTPEFQFGLQSQILDGLDLTLQQSILNTSGKTSEEVHLGGLLGFTLPAYRGVMNNFDLASVSVSISTNQALIIELFSELIANANQATVRRLQREQKEIAWEDCSSSKVLKSQDGIRVVIEDHGDPREYEATRGIGKSSVAPSRVGFGIGRFRAHLIASYLGYTIAHRAKSDGSGSIVEILIPREAEVHSPR